MNTAFEFKQCITLLKSAGMKAGNLRELRDLISSASAGTIFHHTYEYFLKGHILEYTNDFAHWAGKSLEESALAEQLSNIDPYVYGNIEDLRGELLRVIDEYLTEFPEPRGALRGDEFYFNETIRIVFPAGIRAANLAEFLMAIKYVEESSLYYHFYDARVRLGRQNDDFSVWFGDVLGKKGLADKMRTIDPFMHNLAAIRERIAGAVEAEVRGDIEFAGDRP